jgi:hypothetical protein
MELALEGYALRSIAATKSTFEKGAINRVRFLLLATTAFLSAGFYTCSY